LSRRGNGLPACRSASQAEFIQRDTATISRSASGTRADPSSGPIGGGRIFFEEGSRENLDVGRAKLDSFATTFRLKKLLKEYLHGNDGFDSESNVLAL
jgi:hypothetical protein